jgi:hypothetical protein
MSRGHSHGAQPHTTESTDKVFQLPFRRGARLGSGKIRSPNTSGKENEVPAPKTRDYFAELYAAAMFGDAGWSVYFPKRDVGFDFIATKQIRGRVLMRPVQVKGKFPTRGKSDSRGIGFNGPLTAIHKEMVLVIPYFRDDDSRAPEQIAFMPLDQLKKPRAGGFRCIPARFEDGHAIPRRESTKYFGEDGLKRVEHRGWGRGA